MLNEPDDLLDITSDGVPKTSLPPEPEELGALNSLCDAILSSEENRGPSTEKLQSLVARYPDALSGWVAMGRIALANEETISAYAYFRVAYHRGLDKAPRLRLARRWAHPLGNPRQSAVFGAPFMAWLNAPTPSENPPRRNAAMNF